MQDTSVQSLHQEDPLEKEMVIHSSILAWEIPWTDEPDRLPEGSQRVIHDLVTKQQQVKPKSNTLKTVRHCRKKLKLTQMETQTIFLDWRS